MEKTKDVVAGMGEIGKPIFNLISQATKVFGYDLNPKLIDKKQNEKLQDLDVRILHVCIPFNKKFIKNVRNLGKKFDPKIIVIHSTVSPWATSKIQTEFAIPVIYSATRGVHKRMLHDLKRYTKFYAIEPNAPRARWALTNLQNKKGKLSLDQVPIL